MSADRTRWYTGGLKFECQQTGKCCVNHGDYAYVYLKRRDEGRLARHFDLSLYSFRRRYTQVLDGHRILRSAGDACIFLDGHLCSVHEARPIQCRTWPFWSDNLEDEKAWREATSFCAGIGRGRRYAEGEIDDLADLNDD